MAILALSCLLMGAGMLVVAQATGVGMVVVGTLIMGAGVGPAMPNDSTYFMAFVPMLRGRASGLLTTAFYAGQFASPRVSAPLVARSGLEGAFAALGLIVIAMAGLLSASGVLRHRTARVS